MVSKLNFGMTRGKVCQFCEKMLAYRNLGYSFYKDGVIRCEII